MDMEPRIECPNCRTEYARRRFRCTTCPHVAFPSLYKYRRFEEHSLSILRDETLWCPKASELNDPGEFKFRLTEDSVYGIAIDKGSLAVAEQQVKGLRVVCLSETDDNIRMWSRYADEHTGFCIEFERNENNDLGNWDLCVPVSYRHNNEVPKFTSAEIESRAAFAKIVSSKASAWAYEREWRLIVQPNRRQIPLPGRIASIAFGCRMDRVGQRTIAKILGPDMVYRKAIERKKTLGLEIRPIPFEEIVEGS